MKDPKVIVALIYAVTALLISAVIMQPVYECMGKTNGSMGQAAVCLHGMPNS